MKHAAHSRELTKVLVQRDEYASLAMRDGEDLCVAWVPLPFPAVTLLPGEAQKVRRGHAVPLRVPADANGAPWVRLLASGELVALGHPEPLGRGALALVKPKIVLQD